MQNNQPLVIAGRITPEQAAIIRGRFSAVTQTSNGRPHNGAGIGL